MANTTGGMNSVPSLTRISNQISEISESLWSLYDTRCQLYDAERHAEVEAISVEIARWERRVEQLQAARAAMRQAADLAAQQAWAAAQASWSHVSSVA